MRALLRVVDRARIAVSIAGRAPLRMRGFGLLVFFALIGIAVLVAIGVLLGVTDNGTDPAQRDRISLAALAKAKEALIAYAVTVQPDTYAKRPGDLPCPDLNNDGASELTCFDSARRLGRLPWKTLEIPDLRDGYGERLWYALSANYQRKTFNQCPAAGDPACLNSETLGTLTVRDNLGTMLHDGSNLPSGAIAVVLAPGPVLTRLGASGPQDRSCAGDADPLLCEHKAVCTGAASARCQASNYLDIAGPPVLSVPGVGGGTEDNANFSDTSNDNGLISGPVRASGGNVIANDILLVVRYQDLMPLLEQRVAREALNCLHDYAAAPAPGAGRYPWAAAVAADYEAALPDQSGERRGRLPQTLANTKTSNSGMSATWPANCPVSMDASKKAWWANWKNQVFFAVATGYGPDTAAPSCTGGCITVNPPSAAPDKRVVVLVAGRPLAVQARGVGANQSNYLEATNATGATQFERGSSTALFNDVVVFE